MRRLATDRASEMTASGDKPSALDLDFRFKEPQRGTLLKRLNRFLVKVKLRGPEVDCFMANPARGETLFRPGAEVVVREAITLRHLRFDEGPFPAGFYIYTGSAKRNLLHRTARHLTIKHKRRWHIDYLLGSDRARILDVVILPGREQSECHANCEVGRMPGAVVVLKGFGSSDCRSGCPAHLYLFERLPQRFRERLPGFGR